MQAYSSDNGIYISKEFTKEFFGKGQGIRRSGVGGHHHNGCAENEIKTTVRLERTMMIHAELNWPKMRAGNLWPYALNQAAHLHNHSSDIKSGFTPEDLLTRTKSSYSYVKNARIWGCPAYVLTPRLQDGFKIPKWEPRSKQGQYLGVILYHASTVGTVRNLRTENISPQFHCVYDDFFETVNSTPEEEPKVWPELITFQGYLSEIDDED